MLQRIPPGRKVSIERDTFPEVVAGRRLFALATDDYWIDAGVPELYLQANLDMLDGARRHHTSLGVHHGARVEPTATVTHSIVAEGATVGALATITDAVLLPGAVVHDRAVVANSVVMGKIGDGANVMHCVLGLDGRVAAGEHVSGEYRPPADPT